MSVWNGRREICMVVGEPGLSVGPTPLQRECDANGIECYGC